MARSVVLGRIRLTKRQDLTVLALITSITGLVSFLVMYLVLSSTFIIGWDTSAYIYGTRVLAESGMQKFLELTAYGSQGVLYYFLLYGSYITTGESLFVLDKVLTSFLFAGILMSVPLVIFKWTGNPHLALVSLLFGIGWAAPYILASNLHSNLLGFLFVLLALAFLPDGLFSSSKTYLIVIVLMFLASLSHPQSAVYFGLVIVFSSCLAMIASVHRKALFLRVMFLFFVSFTQVILSVVLSGQPTIFGPLLNPTMNSGGGIPTTDFAWGLQLVGYAMLPIIIYSVFITLNRTLESYREPSRQRESLVYSMVLVWSVSTLLLWFSSYLLPVLSSYVGRLLVIFPSPLLLTIGFARIWGDLSQRKQE